MKLTAFELVLLFYWKENENVFWFEAAFVSYTYVYLVFVAGVLLGLAGFLPVSEKKSLQGKAGAQFAASYLLAGLFNLLLNLLV